MCIYTQFSFLWTLWQICYVIYMHRYIHVHVHVHVHVYMYAYIVDTCKSKAELMLKYHLLILQRSDYLLNRLLYSTIIKKSQFPIIVFSWWANTDFEQLSKHWLWAVQNPFAHLLFQALVFSYINLHTVAKISDSSSTHHTKYVCTTASTCTCKWKTSTNGGLLVSRTRLYSSICTLN